MDRKDGEKKMEKLFNFRPVFFASVFLCLGIVFCFLNYFYDVSALWLLVLLPLAGTSFFFCRNKMQVWRTACSIALLGAAFFVGFFAFSLQLTNFFARNDLLGKHYVSGYVTEIRLYDGQNGYVLDDLRFGGERVDGKLIAYLPTSNTQDVTLCDELFLYGNVSETSVDGDSFALMAGEFGDDIRFRLWAEEATVTGERFHLFLSVRMRAEAVIERGMDETTAAVTKGMLFGNTEGMDENLYDSIRRGGIAHIFAVSGLHVGSLFAFCLLLTEKTALRKLPKPLRLLLLAVLLFFYAGLCNFSASVLRASVLCLVGYASALLTVKTDFLESLGLALVFILLSTPSALFEVGCQLSFAACFGIAFFSKPIGHVFDELEKLYRKFFPKKLTRTEREALKNDDTMPPRIGERIYRAIASFFAACIGAQVFTAPILLHTFGYVSGWGLLLNCIFVPLTSALFSVLLLFVIVACMLPVEFAFVVLYVPNVVWSLAILIFQVFEFSSFAIEGWKLSAGAIVTYYAGCTFLTDKWHVKKSFSFLFAVGCFLTFAITIVALNV